MTQNTISLTLVQDDITAINAALDILESKLAGLEELSVDERRSLAKMGDKSEAFCRQTLIVLDQNRHMIPPSLDLAGAEADLHTLDLLRPVSSRMRQLNSRLNDGETRLGNRVLSTSLDGYAIAQVIGKGAGLETLREAMSTRLSRRSKPRDTPAPSSD